MGALIGAVVGVVFYLIKNAQEKKKQQNNDVLDSE